MSGRFNMPPPASSSLSVRPPYRLPPCLAGRGADSPPLTSKRFS